MRNAIIALGSALVGAVVAVVAMNVRIDGTIIVTIAEGAAVIESDDEESALDVLYRDIRDMINVQR